MVLVKTSPSHIVARHAEPGGSRVGRPGPARQPEDNGEDVADKGANAIEILRELDLKSRGAAVDDKTQEGLGNTMLGV